MSWLWDVEFAGLRAEGVAVVTGVRAWDMALRLEHDGVRVDDVNENLSEALRKFITTSGDAPMRIFCTYTAMLALREELTKFTDVERVS